MSCFRRAAVQFESLPSTAEPFQVIISNELKASGKRDGKEFVINTEKDLSDCEMEIEYCYKFVFLAFQRTKYLSGTGISFAV